jgi:hypothetical protein
MKKLPHDKIAFWLTGLSALALATYGPFYLFFCMDWNFPVWNLLPKSVQETVGWSMGILINVASLYSLVSLFHFWMTSKSWKMVACLLINLSFLALMFFVAHNEDQPVVPHAHKIDLPSQSH